MSRRLSNRYWSYPEFPQWTSFYLSFSRNNDCRYLYFFFFPWPSSYGVQKTNGKKIVSWYLIKHKEERRGSVYGNVFFGDNDARHDLTQQVIIMNEKHTPESALRFTRCLQSRLSLQANAMELPFPSRASARLTDQLSNAMSYMCFPLVSSSQNCLTDVIFCAGYGVAKCPYSRSWHLRTFFFFYITRMQCLGKKIVKENTTRFNSQTDRGQVRGPWRGTLILLYWKNLRLRKENQ